MSYNDYEWLYNRYVDERLSSIKIASGCDVTHSTILYWLKIFGIERRTISEANKGKIRTRFVREAQSRRMVNYHKNNTHYLLGKTRSLETRKKISETNKRKGIKPPSAEGRVFPYEERVRRSASLQRIELDEWNGFVAFEPYAPSFNFALKEEIRNRDGRVCQRCGKSELFEGRRLCVHHRDGNKMNSSKDNLDTLCNVCNNASDTLEKEFLLAVRGWVS